MSLKKSFKDNPALQFITETTDDSENKQNITVDAIQEKVSKSHQPLSRESKYFPQGYKINPELYVETKSRRLQLIIQPSLYDRVKSAANKEELSVNEYIHRVLDAATKEKS